MNQLVKDLVPPIVKRILKYQFRYGWHGNFNSWEAANASSTGYGFDKIINKVTTAAEKVKNGEVAYERDGVVYDRKPLYLHVLAGLLLAASKNGNRLTVMDYGGSLGTLYYQQRPHLKHLSDLKWGIIEQPAFVKVGREKFQDENLSFFSDIDEFMASHTPDIVIFCGSIQYLREPYKELEKLLSHNIRFLLFDFMAFVEGPKDRLTIQKVPPYYYEGSYPCWFFGREKFMDFMKSRYNLLSGFEAGIASA